MTCLANVNAGENRIGLKGVEISGDTNNDVAAGASLRYLPLLLASADSYNEIGNPGSWRIPAKTLQGCFIAGFFTISSWSISSSESNMICFHFYFPWAPLGSISKKKNESRTKSVCLQKVLHNKQRSERTLVPLMSKRTPKTLGVRSPRPNQNICFF